jgi:hypothetical protein
MNDITIFIFGIGFALTAGAAFAFMWRSMGYVFKEMDKYVDRPRKPVHPEMKEVQDGDELLVFELKDDDKDISS